MVKQILSNVDYYLLEDHAARRRTTFIGAGIGLVVGTLTQAFGFPISITAGICFATAGVVEVTRAVTYKQPLRTGKSTAAVFSVRRQLIYGAFSAVSFLVLSLLRLPHLEARTVERKLQEAANDPSSPKNIAEVKTVIARAKDAGIIVPGSIIGDVGKKFVAAAKTNPDAWDAALTFVGYRSFLNVQGAPTLTGASVTTHYQTFNFSPTKHPTMFAYGTAPPSQAARLNRIGQNLNQGLPSGNVYILLDGDEAVIDGTEMKNVIFRNVHVIYYGGPLIMENVRFINCTFNLVRQPNGQVLADKLLAAPSVNFTSS